jgi:sec-independent protein translocase protein TatB
MFDFDAGKLIVIGLVALIVIGPKELPRVLRQLGQGISKMRRMAGEFQGQFMEAMREAEIEEIRKDVAKVADVAKVDVNFDPVQTVRNEIGGALEGRTTSGAPETSVPTPDGPSPEIINMPDLPAPHEPATEATIAAAVAPVAPDAVSAPAEPPKA